MSIKIGDERIILIWSEPSGNGKSLSVLPKTVKFHLQQRPSREARLLETHGQRRITMADRFQEVPLNATMEERDEEDEEDKG